MSNPLPNQLALTVIADGSPRIAAPLRNNYAAIQAAVNELIVAYGVTAKGDLVVATASGAVQVVSVGTDGQVLLADSTQPAGVRWGTVTPATPPGTELDYKQITAPVTVTGGTNEGTAVTCITSNSVTYDGTRVKVEVFTPHFAGGTTNEFLVLLRDTTVLGQLQGPGAGGGGQGDGPVKAEFFDTPTAAAHTYTVKAFTSGAAGTFVAGPGGTGAQVPAFIRVTKA